MTQRCRKEWGNMSDIAEGIIREELESENEKLRAQIEARPDLSAYIIEASVQIAEEQNFNPTDMADLERWWHANTEAIYSRFCYLQEALFKKILKHEKDVTETLASTVWQRIRKEKGEG
jgi:hypothetical protein